MRDSSEWWCSCIHYFHTNGYQLVIIIESYRRYLKNRSTYHDLTSGTSKALRIRPLRRLNGLGAHNNEIPLEVLSV